VVFEALASLIALVVVVVVVALLLGGGEGIFGRYRGRVMRDGDLSSPTGRFSEPDRTFEKPPDEQELL